MTPLEAVTIVLTILFLLCLGLIMGLMRQLRSAAMECVRLQEENRLLRRPNLRGA
jgi:hypothetical protein